MNKKTITRNFIYTDKYFGNRIRELLQAASRLAAKEKDGWRYEKVWVAPTKVRAHKRRGHYTLRPVKRPVKRIP